jgi:hypothetical protein
MFRWLALILCITSMAFAQQKTIDLSKIDPQLAAQILAAEHDTTTTIQKATKYVNLGKQVAIVIKDCAAELSVSVNDFVKTPVGKGVSFLIIWNYFGKDAIEHIGGFFLLIFIQLFTFIVHFRYFGIKKLKIYDASKNVCDIKYIARYPWSTDVAWDDDMIYPRGVFALILGVFWFFGTVVSFGYIF